MSKAASYLDETVDYYAFGPKDKAFVTEQMRQFLAALSMRSFTVSDVKVQDSSKPMIATVVFDVRYSARDVLGNSGTDHTCVEWDLAKRGDSLKIVRSNWMTYPDSSPDDRRVGGQRSADHDVSVNRSQFATGSTRPPQTQPH